MEKHIQAPHVSKGILMSAVSGSPPLRACCPNSFWVALANLFASGRRQRAFVSSPRANKFARATRQVREQVK